MWLIVLYMLLSAAGLALLVGAGHYIEHHEEHSLRVLMTESTLSSVGVVACLTSVALVFMAATHTTSVSSRPMASVGAIVYALLVYSSSVLIVMRNLTIRGEAPSS